MRYSVVCGDSHASDVVELDVYLSVFPELVNGQKGVGESGDASDIADDDVCPLAGVVPGESWKVADAADLQRFTVDAGYRAYTGSRVDEIGSTRVAMPGAAAVDDGPAAGVSKPVACGGAGSRSGTGRLIPPVLRARLSG